jgi:hypothetical protein
MRKTKNAPTPEQITYFFERIAHHQVRLNLQDWRLEPTNKPAGKGCLADVSVSPEDKLAVISIGGDWHSMPINE